MGGQPPEEKKDIKAQFVDKLGTTIGGKYKVERLQCDSVKYYYIIQNNN